MDKGYVLQLCHDYNAPFLSVSRQYARLFQESEYKVVTVYLKGEPDTEITEASSADKVIYLSLQSGDLTGLKRSTIAKIRSLNEQYKFKLCIAQRYKSTYIATHIKNLPVFSISHIDGVFSKIFRKLLVRFNNKQLYLFGVSKAIRDDIREALPFIGADRIQHIYNSLDFTAIRSAQLEREDSREKLGITSGCFAFGTIGRLHEDKDQATLIRAFSHIAQKMPNANLYIIGAGRLEQKLRQQIIDADLQDRIILTGLVPEAYRYIRAFDSFVLSSIREGLPVSMLEAFAARVPCAGSLCNGNTEALEGCGMSFPIGDDVALSEIMENLFALTKEEREDWLKKIDAKIDSDFSEAAVRNFFWQLPSVKKLLSTENRSSFK